MLMRLSRTFLTGLSLKVALAGSLAIALTVIPNAGARTDATGATKGRVIIAEFGGAYSKSIRDTLANPFSRASGYKATVVDTTDRVQKPLAMIKANRVQWDIVEVLDTEAIQLQKQGGLQPIPPTIRTQLEKVLNPGTVTRFGVAISSYTQLIVCNKDAVARCPRTAAEFFDTTGFPGRRAVNKGDWITNLSLGLQADGVAPKDLFPMNVSRSLRKWEELKGKVAVYWESADQLQQLFRDREIDMAIGPDGRMWNLVNEGLNLQISYRGMLYQTDYFVVLRKAPNREGAFEFFRWYGTHPQAQANFARQRLYGMPHPGAYRFLPAKVRSQLVDYPPNKRQTVPLDVPWVIANGAAASKAWADFLAG
jgi:putative spermidine/putrescine transport system substrate-binding protein